MASWGKDLKEIEIRATLIINIVITRMEFLIKAKELIKDSFQINIILKLQIVHN